MSIYKRIRHSLRPLRVGYERVLGRIAPKKLVSIYFKRAYGKKLDWNHPTNLDEKINWLKFFSDTSKWTILADKYRVRQFLIDNNLENCLPKLYGVWDKAEEIDWDSLPNTFVMKTNHGSGDVLICKDKHKIDYSYWTKKFRRWLKTDFSSIMGEPHYREIKPCIIAEELLDTNKQAIDSSSLIDYKIWSFNGMPAYIWVCFNRTPHSVEVITYDTDWNPHPEFSVTTDHYILTDKRIPRPKSLDTMLSIASTLSKGLEEVRVDLYEVDGKPYFGEMTLTAAGGINNFYTQEFLQILGQHITLPK